MNTQVYEQLAAALDRLPNGFPRTPGNWEIPLLQKIFSDGEAALASSLSRDWETPAEIAARTGGVEREVRSRLMKMVKRGLIWLNRQPGDSRFRLAPFIVGIFEAQLDAMDRDLAHLVEQYLTDGGAVGMMKPHPAIHRVVPATGSVKSEWILPYDDVRALLEKARTFSVRDCICRVQQEALESRRCDASLLNCLSFSQSERPPRPEDISREEALAILEKTESEGLVHSVSNTVAGVGYVCNCCGCCCGVLRGVTEFGITESMAAANYRAVVDAETCGECGLCGDRCQVDAIDLSNGVPEIAEASCIGCGLCVTTCPEAALSLQRLPEDQIVEPPADFDTWQEQRLASRGLT